MLADIPRASDSSMGCAHGAGLVNTNMFLFCPPKDFRSITKSSLHLGSKSFTPNQLKPSILTSTRVKLHTDNRLARAKWGQSPAMMIGSDDLGFQPDVLLAMALSISLATNLLLSVLAAQAKRRFTIAYDTRKSPQRSTPSTPKKLNLTDPVQVTYYMYELLLREVIIKHLVTQACLPRHLSTEHLEANVPILNIKTPSEAHFSHPQNIPCIFPYS
jgi:hypothetical protein